MVIRGISDQCHYARSNTGHDIRYACSVKLTTYLSTRFLFRNMNKRIYYRELISKN